MDDYQKEKEPVYLLARIYAERNNISLKALLKSCEKGKQRTARKVGHHWLIEENAPCSIMPIPVVEKLRLRMEENLELGK